MRHQIRNADQRILAAVVRKRLSKAADLDVAEDFVISEW